MSLFLTSESKKRKKLFWVLQFVFWLSHWLLWLLLMPNNFLYYQSFIIHLAQYLLPLTFSLGLRYLYKRYNIQRMHLFPMILIVFILSIIGGVAWVIVQQFLLFAFWGVLNINKISLDLFISIFYQFYPFVAWSAIYLGFKIYEDYIFQKQNAERAYSLAQSAQLEMLRYQLNPHFLFNTLSSLRALIRRKENDIAEKMVTKISEFLKYSLLEGEDSKVPLSREIRTINHYFDIEKVRFKNQMMIEFNIDPQTENHLIPVFLIHPLIENAVKHGMKTSPSPLKISINTKLKNKSLWIEITNSGKWIERDPVDDTTRTGLQNTQKRLILAYPKDHMIEIVKNDDSVCIRIIIHTITN